MEGTPRGVDLEGVERELLSGSGVRSVHDLLRQGMDLELLIAGTGDAEPQLRELIAELGLAMTLEATYEEIESTIHAHPTLSEAVHEATAAAFGQAA